MSEQNKILELRKLKKYFPAGGKQLKAVEDVSFILYQGEVLGVVGESGCGKSTLGRTILQLYNQTSGSCVYYGKSIQEMNPGYVMKEIDSLADYQKNAKDFYQKSLGVDAKIEELKAKADALDPDGSASDAKKYDKIQKEIAKLELESSEYRKDASRQLREGSRTIGSLILSPHLKEVADLFRKSEEEVKKVHDTFLKQEEAQNALDNNLTLMEQKESVDEWIATLEAKEDRSQQETYHLADLKHIKKEVAKVDVASLQKENEALKTKIEGLKAEVETHRKASQDYRAEAFEKYGNRDYLPITERTNDREYQDKLDRNYETGINLSKLSAKELREIRPDLQMVFQDPAASLDPRESVGRAIEEVFQIHTNMSKMLRREKTLELIQEVGLKPEHYYSYPHSLSGGMKQRVGIARAIALDPSFVVLDEAVSALDVSVQAQILQLLNRLKEEKNLTYLFITHDLGVVRHFCDRVLVMYLGNTCEIAPNKSIFAHPYHPYTQSLLKAVPRMKVGERANEEDILQGEVPSPIDPPSGCPFHTRCKSCMEICKKKKPAGIEVEKDHVVFCHLYAKGENA